MDDLTIPQDQRAAATRALDKAFGVSECDDIRRLPGSHANPVFRIAVRGSAYLMRFNLRRGDVARHFSCMKAAAGAGLAPRVWYTSVDDRLSITDFVEAVPWPVNGALHLIPAALRTLHALPPFPGAPDHLNTTCTFLLGKGPAVDGLQQAVRASGILPKDDCDELAARHAQLAAAYPRREADMVSSHNDLFKPDNMLFDGRRLWLVDWEAAFRNDRYADLAVAAIQLAANEEEEGRYLEAYFGAPPDGYQWARFFLMQQVAHMFYALVFLLQGAAGQPIDWSAPVPSFADFQRRFWAGEIRLADARAKAEYGRVHWNQLWYNLRQPRFEEAMRVVAAEN